ncbi:MAG: DoxX family protein [Bacteroidetes bacterium]|nr:DoxX family protein [Bacteroidota bacterium]
MRKLLSTNYSAAAFNIAMLLLRIVFGILLMNHGYGKLSHFTDTSQHMPQFLGMSSSITTALVVFAEFFCALFVILGLFTRFAAMIIVINMSYALIVAHKWDVFSTGEMATLFLGAFFVLLLIGPGKISVDGMSGK